MANGKWFGRGFDPAGFKPPSPSHVGFGQDPYNRGRFWIRLGEEKPWIFLDGFNECFRFAEHYPGFDVLARRYYHFTCPLVNLDKPCHLHDLKVGVYRAVAFTGIDRNGYIPSRGENAGKQITNIKRLLIVPERHLWILVKKNREINGLKFAEFTISRHLRDAVIGDDWSFVRKTNPGELEAQKIDLRPFDYEKVIPINITADDQRKFIDENPAFNFSRKDSPPAPAETSSSETEIPEDVPF